MKKNNYLLKGLTNYLTFILLSSTNAQGVSVNVKQKSWIKTVNHRLLSSVKIQFTIVVMIKNI
jgi:hypothetical protein